MKRKEDIYIEDWEIEKIPLSTTKADIMIEKGYMQRRLRRI